VREVVISVTATEAEQRFEEGSADHGLAYVGYMNRCRNKIPICKDCISAIPGRPVRGLLLPIRCRDARDRLSVAAGLALEHRV